MPDPKKPSRRPKRVKITGDPFAIIDKMLGKDGSSPMPDPEPDDSEGDEEPETDTVRD